MMCSHPRTVRLVMAVTDPDGGVHTRHWKFSADGLAEELGPPIAETVASAEAVTRVWEDLGGIPGIVRTGGS